MHHALIVDDNKDLLDLMALMVKKRGYQVTARSEMPDMESLIAQGPPDLLVMDMLLSGLNGCDLCRAWKAHSELRKVPIIMISAHPRAKAECEAAGADAFLFKPFGMANFHAALDALLKK